MSNQSVTIPAAHLEKLKNLLQQQEILYFTNGKLGYELRILTQESTNIHMQLDNIQTEITETVKTIEKETGISGLIDIESGVITPE